jgi:branched-chain amino acid transport system permease protein
LFEIFGSPSTALLGQLLVGLINGSFYALLSLGLAVIFGMLNIINFEHGAQYMMGAFAAYLLLDYLDIGYWPALVIVPIIVGVIGIAIERLFLQWLYRLDHLYGLLLTFGLALIIEGASVNASARRDCLIGCRNPCRARRTSDLCSCPTIAPG